MSHLPLKLCHSGNVDDDDDDDGLDPESGKLSGLEETETLHKVNVAIMLPNTPKRNAILYLCCKI